jgi:predicted MPP superfamily phosphohydrolase
VPAGDVFFVVSGFALIVGCAITAADTISINNKETILEKVNCIVIVFISDLRYGKEWFSIEYNKFLYKRFK